MKDTNAFCSFPTNLYTNLLRFTTDIRIRDITLQNSFLTLQNEKDFNKNQALHPFHTYQTP